MNSSCPSRGTLYTILPQHVGRQVTGCIVIVAEVLLIFMVFVGRSGFSF